jgi:hypothetical protein
MLLSPNGSLNENLTYSPFSIPEIRCPFLSQQTLDLGRYLTLLEDIATGLQYPTIECNQLIVGRMAHPAPPIPDGKCKKKEAANISSLI